MVSRIRSLGAKKLSYAGRVVLINSVLNTLYNYWAAMFVIPKAAIKRVEAICRNFLWDSSTEFHRVPLVGWDRVTLSKAAGGLGIKHASTWNIASVGKLVNWIYMKADRLWIKWVDSIYLKGTNWHEYKPANDTTWIWKSICKVKERIKDGFVDNVWLPHPKGYTIGNGYEWLMGNSPGQKWTTVVWNEWNIPKHSFIAWLSMQEGLNVKSKLFAYGFCQDDRCILCADHTETTDHLFHGCQFSCTVQKCIEDWIGSPVPSIDELMNTNQKTMKWKALAMIVIAYRYAVWTHRNKARIDLCVMRPEMVADGIRRMMQQQLRRRCMIKEEMTEMEMRTRLGFS